MREAYEVEKGTRCDFCEKDAVMQFRLIRLARTPQRKLVRVWQGEYMAACTQHINRAADCANAGIRR